MVVEELDEVEEEARGLAGGGKKERKRQVDQINWGDWDGGTGAIWRRRGSSARGCLSAVSPELQR